MQKTKFNYVPKNHAKITRDAAYSDEGIPLYSERRTPGTVAAEKLLKTLVKPMPVPPRRYNGDFCR